MKKTLPPVDEQMLFDYSFAELLFEEVKGTYKAFATSEEAKILVQQIQLLRNIVTDLYFSGAERCKEVMGKYIKKVNKLLALYTIHAAEAV